MSKGNCIVICCLVVLLVGATSALGMPILDQAQEAYSGDHIFGHNGPDRVTATAQVFTPGISGQLWTLDLWLSNCLGGPLKVSIVDTVAGAPLGASLGSADISSWSAGEWRSLDFHNENIWLNSGTQYAFIMETREPADGFGYIRVMWDPASYTGGELWSSLSVRNSGAWEIAQATRSDGSRIGGDAGFRTWMESSASSSAPIPEPATLALFATAVAGAGFMRKRRK